MDFRVEWTDDFTRMTRYAYATGRFLEEWLEIITKHTGTNFSAKVEVYGRTCCRRGN